MFSMAALMVPAGLWTNHLFNLTLEVTYGKSVREIAAIYVSSEHSNNQHFDLWLYQSKPTKVHIAHNLWTSND